MRAFRSVRASTPRDDGARSPIPADRLLTGVVRAEGRRTPSLLIDLGVAGLAGAVAAAVTAAVAAASTTVVIVIGVLLAAATCGALLLDRHRSGRSVGHRLLGLRTIDRRTALPRLGAGSHALTADLRSGRDPLHLRPALAVAVADRDRWVVEEHPQASARLVLATDDGFAQRVERSAIIGRNPANPPGMEHQLVGVTDLSRTMSKSHALLEPDGDALWVTDLTSTNGTAVTGPEGHLQRIPPRARVRVVVGSQLAFGDRVMSLARAGATGDLQRQEATA